MNASFDWDGRLIAPNALRLSHDMARVRMTRAVRSGGRVAEAAERVSQLCLPHFAHEEGYVFPVLALLPYIQHDRLQPKMLDVMPLVAAFRAKRQTLETHHISIMASIAELAQAAEVERDREVAEFVHHLRVHEWIEDEVVYPTVIMVGQFLQEKFAN